MDTDLDFDRLDGSTATRTRQVRTAKPKGLEFAQFTLALAAAKGNPMQAVEIAKRKLGESNDVVSVLKAAVSAGTTTDPNWAGPLHETYQRFAGDFVEFLRSKTITGAFGRNGVPSLRNVPFNLKIPTQTTGGAAHWVAQGAPIPLTKFDFDLIELGHKKLGAIAVITEELARWSEPSAELIVRDQLAAALVETLDRDFISTDAEVTGVSPAGIRNGVAAITSSGSDIEAIKRDVEALYFEFLDADNPPETGVILMSSKLALRLSLMQNALGGYEFAGLTYAGGRFLGLPVITSNYIDDSEVILLNASDIYFAEGGIDVDVSDSVSLEMLDNPTNNSATPTGTNLTSMWQTNSIATKVLKYVDYKRRRPTAVAWLDGVAWGRSGS